MVNFKLSNEMLNLQNGSEEGKNVKYSREPNLVAGLFTQGFCRVNSATAISFYISVSR